MANPTNTFKYAADVVVQNARGWENLNQVAKALVEIRAFDADHAVSVSKIARLSDLDSSHVSRLIKDKVGFVRTYRETESGAYQGTGVYYHPEVYGATAGYDYAYPKTKDLINLSRRLGPAGIPSTVVEPYSGTRRRKSDETFPINGFLEDRIIKAGLPIAGSVRVPYIPLPTDATVKDLVDTLGLNDFTDVPGETALGILPDSDLSGIIDEVSKRLVNYAGFFSLLDNLRKAREVT